MKTAEAADHAQRGDLIRLDDLGAATHDPGKDATTRRDGAVMRHLVSVMDYANFTITNFKALGDLIDMSTGDVRAAVDSLREMGVIATAPAKRGCAKVRLIRAEQSADEKALDRRMRLAGMRIVV